MVALLESLVQFHAADHRTQRGLCKLRDGQFEVARSVGRQFGIRHLEIQDAVDLQLRIVLGDADLAGNVERNLAQVVLVTHGVDERDDEIQPRLQNAMESAEALDHEGALLRNDAEVAGQQHHHGNDKQHKEEQFEFHIRSPKVRPVIYAGP